jgi:tetratricopeptide (TPR) repeat protein
MPPFDVSRVSLSPAEKEVLDHARTEVRLADVLARPTSRPLAVRALYALLCGEILEEVSLPAPATRLPHPPEMGTFQMAVAPERAARATPAAAPPQPMGLREHILGLYEALPRASHYEILEIAPNATVHEVDGAYRRLTAEQDREWRDLMGDVQLSSMLSTLRLRRREAYLVLSDPNRRAAYDKRLGATAPVNQGEVTAERNSRARVLVQQAQALIERGDSERAIPQLLEAVDLDPEEHAARRLLALALSNSPTLSRNAERHFLAALEQEPGDVDLRYRLARYYRRLGLPARALVHLRTVLRSDPDHAGAAHELTLIEEAGHGR